ncbi:MAG TPA: hypothetical protein VNU44_11945, partial [Bryobacteraceae bacterium]|nr:hypothetical protein [Bryobacteraceae bacterium]
KKRFVRNTWRPIVIANEVDFPLLQDLLSRFVRLTVTLATNVGTLLGQTHFRGKSGGKAPTGKSGTDETVPALFEPLEPRRFYTINKYEVDLSDRKAIPRPYQRGGVASRDVDIAVAKGDVAISPP